MKDKLYLWILIIGLYLGVYNGNLAICEEGISKPMMILPYKVQFFPKDDQQRLIKGIPFDNADELQRLMEDFMS